MTIIINKNIQTNNFELILLFGLICRKKVPEKNLNECEFFVVIKINHRVIGLDCERVFFPNMMN